MPRADAIATDALTGDEVRILRVVRLNWTLPEFAALFGVSTTAVQRWESTRDKQTRADRPWRSWLVLLRDVLDNAPTARERLSEARGEGTHRLQFLLLGMKYDDTPWRDKVAISQNPLAAKLSRARSAA